MDTKAVMLNERMQECDIQTKDIIDKIEISEDDRCTVIVYISKFEGLGNKHSDFDVYVLSEGNIKENKNMVRINGAVCDIEYWTYSKIFEIFSVGIEDDEYRTIKLLKRLDIGLLVYNNSELYGKFKIHFQEINIDKMIYRFFKSASNEEYDDAVKMFRCREYVSALTCARRCADNMIAAYNSKKGHTNLNLKWAPKIFFENNCYGNSFIMNGYKNYQLYMNVTEENIDSKTKEMIEFLTDAISQIVMEEK